jgi:hypothetical protein
MIGCLKSKPRTSIGDGYNENPNVWTDKNRLTLFSTKHQHESLRSPSTINTSLSQVPTLPEGQLMNHGGQI